MAMVSGSTAPQAVTRPAGRPTSALRLEVVLHAVRQLHLHDGVGVAAERGRAGVERAGGRGSIEQLVVDLLHPEVTRLLRLEDRERHLRPGSAAVDLVHPEGTTGGRRVPAEEL